MKRQAFDSKLASGIFECRRALRALWGARYGERIAEYKDLLAEVREQTRESVLLTAQRFVKTLRRDAGDGPTQIAFLAAAVDLLEEAR
jgi:hypothetical protein